MRRVHISRVKGVVAVFAGYSYLMPLKYKFKIRLPPSRTTRLEEGNAYTNYQHC